MDDALAPCVFSPQAEKNSTVLILVVMDDALAQDFTINN